MHRLGGFTNLRMLQVQLVALTCFSALPIAAFAWPVPTLRVPRLTGPIEPDGRLDEPAWAGAGLLPLLCDHQTGRVAEVTTQALVAWDAGALYLGVRCQEPRVGDLRATLTARDAPLWGDDSVEVFLRPPDGRTYYQFVVNPLGALYDARAQDASWDCPAVAAAQRFDDAWSCELVIPWSAVGGPPASGDVWTGNFCRGRKAGGSEELTCWSVTGGSFHNPGAFGTLVFATDAGGLAAFGPGDLRPGVNHLRARVRPVGGPLTLTLRATDPPRTLAQAELSTEGPVQLAYELNPDDLCAPLELEVCDPTGQPLFRQAFASRAPVAPSMNELTDTVARLQGMAEAGNGSVLAALRRRGEALLADLAAALEAARQRGQTVDAQAWTRLALGLQSFRAECQRPVISVGAPGAAAGPDRSPSDVSVDIALAVNERESRALFLSVPLLTSPLDCQVRLSDLRPIPEVPGASVPDLRRRVTILEAVPVPLRGGGTIADPLCPLPASGIFRLDPGQTRELWVRFDSEGLTPGYYCGTLNISPLRPGGAAQSLSVPLRVRVWNIELPRQTPVATYVSDYGRCVSSPEHLQELLSHHVTVLNATGLPSPDGEGHADLTRLGALLEPVRGKGQLFLEVWFMRETGWQPRYACWVREVADEMERLGYSYEDWILQIYDETLCEEFLECCKQIKAVEPRVRIFTDYMGTPEQIAAFAPYVDIWCPYWGDLNKQGGECLQAMRDTGKPIWTYDCGSSKTMPVGRYRALPWVAWRHHLDGVYCWCYPGSLWDETSCTDFNYGHTYEGYRGDPVGSKRWEAFSDGMEDLMLLRQYEQAVSAAGERAAEDETLLAQATVFAEQAGSDPAAMAALRTSIARRLLTLRGTPPGTDFPQVGLAGWGVRIAGDGRGAAQVVSGGREDPGELALTLTSPHPQSWAFAVQPVTATVGQRIRLSVWARGRGNLRVGICEGFRFGGDPAGHRISDRYLGLSEEWQQVEVQHVVGAIPVEAFVGFDYGNADAMAVLSDVQLVVAEP